jgi:hypothetical protein
MLIQKGLLVAISFDSQTVWDRLGEVFSLLLVAVQVPWHAAYLRTQKFPERQSRDRVRV